MGQATMKETLREMFTINRGMVKIKAAYSSLYVGVMILFPYLTLQALGLGLRYEDISIIYGIVPVLTFAAAPVSGFIGDKVGYKPVLIASIAGGAIASTMFTVIPAYKEMELTPYTVLARPDAGSSIYTVDSVAWPLCDSDGGPTEVEDCQSFAEEPGAFANLTDYLICETEVLVGEDYDLVVDGLAQTANGTLCSASDANLASSYESVRCKIISHPMMTTCHKTEGDHRTTFFYYLACRAVFQWSINSMFSLFDGAVLRIAKEQGSEYSKVAIWTQLSSTLGSLVPGLILEDPEEGSGETTDYTVLFYVQDACLAVTILITLTLDIRMDRSGQKTREALKQIWSGPAVILFALVFVMGASWGVHDTYLIPYLSDTLNASSSLISYMIFLGGMSNFLANIVAKLVVQRVGDINMLTVGIVLEGLRLVVFSQVVQSPPVYSLWLYALDGLVKALPWVGTMYYAYMICPPDLVATMSAMITTFQYVIGKGTGSFLGGQLSGVPAFGGITGVFFWTGVVASAAAAALLGFYHLVGVRWERGVVSKKEALLEEAENKRRKKEEESAGGEKSLSAGGDHSDEMDDARVTKM